MDTDAVEQLWQFALDNPGEPITVDLPARTIQAGDATYSFGIDDYTAYRLQEGLDDISETLQHEQMIAAFEALRPSFMPTTLPMRIAD